MFAPRGLQCYFSIPHPQRGNSRIITGTISELRAPQTFSVSLVSGESEAAKNPEDMSGLQSRRKLLACLWDLFTLNFPSNLYPVLLILPPSEEETQLHHGIGAMTDELIWGVRCGR